MMHRIQFVIICILTMVVSLSNAQITTHIYPSDSSYLAQKVTLEAFLSPGSKTAIIICPGGSYCWLDYKNEGLDVAKYLQANGINAFVLRYRVAGWWSWLTHDRILIRGNQAPDMYSDGQTALRWLHSHSDEYGIDSNKIGIMGFSAGGHLALSQVIFPQGIKPAFLALLYPVVTMEKGYVHKRSRRGLLGETRKNDYYEKDKWSLENHVPTDCPPIFLVNCVDDPIVDYRNSVILADALTANNIKHLYIQYKTGGHGFGVSDEYGTPESRKWKKRFIDWLIELSLL